MKAGLVIAVALAVTGIVPPATARAPASIWKNGGDVRGTCRAVVAGRAVMNGLCGGGGHGNSIFVTAEKDGCSIELTRGRGGVTGKIFAYKNICAGGDGPPNDGDVNLGRFTLVNGCWQSGTARVCLKPGRVAN
jgi:hypothetical protein